MSFANWFAVGSLLVASPVLAAGTLSGTCTADYSVKATMDSFVGHVTSEPASVDLAKDDSLTITVGIAHMGSGNAKRDLEMLHMFNATNFPLIVGTAKSAALNALAPSAASVDLPLDVTIHGATKSLAAKVSNVSRSDTNLTFEAAFTVPLRDFGLKPPSIMKLIRVDNEVHVVAHVALAK